MRYLVGGGGIFSDPDSSDGGISVSVANSERIFAEKKQRRHS